MRPRVVSFSTTQSNINEANDGSIASTYDILYI